MVEFDLEKAGEELVDKVIISRLFCYTLSTIRLETVDFDKGNGCVAFFEAQLRLLVRSGRWNFRLLQKTRIL